VSAALGARLPAAATQAEAPAQASEGTLDDDPHAWKWCKAPATSACAVPQLCVRAAADRV
jgi:hypothetical protein